MDRYLIRAVERHLPAQPLGQSVEQGGAGGGVRTDGGCGIAASLPPWKRFMKKVSRMSSR